MLFDVFPCQARFNNGSFILEPGAGKSIANPWRAELIPANFDDLVQDYSNSSALAMELLQFCTDHVYVYHFTKKWISC